MELDIKGTIKAGFFLWLHACEAAHCQNVDAEAVPAWFGEGLPIHVGQWGRWNRGGSGQNRSAKGTEKRVDQVQEGLAAMVSSKSTPFS